VRRGARCQCDVLTDRCGAPAVTTRMRPSGGQRWAVCQHHAEFLDRLRERVRQDQDLLDRLAQR
jgi:hypothetical protein